MCGLKGIIWFLKVYCHIFGIESAQYIPLLSVSSAFLNQKTKDQFLAREPGKEKWTASYFNDSLVQFSSVTQLCPTLCDPMNHSTPGLPVYHQLLEFTQTHVHQVGDAIQPSHPLLSPFPPTLNPSQHQGLCQWVSSSHEVAKVLEFQLQH